MPVTEFGMMRTPLVCERSSQRNVNGVIGADEGRLRCGTEDVTEFGMTSTVWQGNINAFGAEIGTEGVTKVTPDGVIDGLTEGARDGLTDGLVEGTIDETIEGTTKGGALEGLTEVIGVIEGMMDGANEGAEGAMEGATEGEVGLSDGAKLGTEEGAQVVAVFTTTTSTLIPSGFEVSVFTR